MLESQSWQLLYYILFIRKTTSKDLQDTNSIELLQFKRSNKLESSTVDSIADGAGQFEDIRKRVQLLLSAMDD